MIFKKLLFLLFTFNIIFSIEINAMKRKINTIETNNINEKSSENKKVKTDNNDNGNDFDNSNIDSQFFDKLTDGYYDYTIESTKTEEEIEKEKKLEALKKDLFEEYQQGSGKTIIKDLIIEAAKDSDYESLFNLLNNFNKINLKNFYIISENSHKPLQLLYYILMQSNFPTYTYNYKNYDLYFHIINYLIDNNNINIKTVHFSMFIHLAISIIYYHYSIPKNEIDYFTRWFIILFIKFANKVNKINNPLSKTKEYTPLLQLAVHNAAKTPLLINLIKYLIMDKNADINIRSHGKTLLIALIDSFVEFNNYYHSSFIPLLELLISKNIDINGLFNAFEDDIDWTRPGCDLVDQDNPLIILAKGNLMQQNINQNKYLCTELINRLDYCTIVKLLIDAGTNVLAKNKEGYCALYNPKIKEIYEEYYKNQLVKIGKLIEKNNTNTYFPGPEIINIIVSYALLTNEEIEALPF